MDHPGHERAFRFTQRGGDGARPGAAAYDRAYGQQFGQQYTLPGSSLRLVDNPSKPGVGGGYGSSSGPLSIASVGLEGRKSLAYLVTLSLLCLFVAPVVLAWHIGRDPDAGFWIGRYGFLATSVPIFVLIMHGLHLIHLLRDGRRKMFILVAAVLPTILLCPIGLLYWTKARGYTLKLFSEDCSHSELPGPALSLQEAYEEARGVFDVCAQRLLREHGGSLAALPRAPLLQNCEEWSRHLAAARLLKRHVDDSVTPWETYQARRASEQSVLQNWDREWWYLASMEANHECSGLCALGPPLWTERLGRAGLERCGPLVALKLQRIGQQGAAIFWASLASTVIFFAMYVAAQPIFGRAGFQD